MNPPPPQTSKLAASAAPAPVAIPIADPSPSSSDITHIPPESPLVDVMAGDARREIGIHEHGFIALVDCMPRLVPTPPRIFASPATAAPALSPGSAPSASSPPTADFAIVQAARVSYGQGTRKISEDRGLIRYLMRHHHTTPFEMIEFKFHVAMPIFVARQWIRHRTANVNEYSARYSVVPDRFYKPSLDNIRKQSVANRQGGSDPIDVGTAQAFLDYLDESESLYAKYLEMTNRGVARELARCALPVSVYTEWYWKCDLHNILHFLSLRMDEHAQVEIRDFANAMFRLMEPIVPITMEAFRDYRLEGLNLTRLEIESLRTGQPLATDNKRELAEWGAKRQRLTPATAPRPTE